MKVDLLVTQLISVTLGCDTWRLLARERGAKTIHLWALLATLKVEYKLLEGQIAFFLIQTKSILFKKNARNARVGRLQTFLSRYQHAFRHVTKRVNNEGLRLYAGLLAGASKAKDEVSQFLHDLVLLIKSCVGEHSARARASVSSRSSTVVEIQRGVETSYTNSYLAVTRFSCYSVA